jgi:hypothetical protein
MKIYHLDDMEDFFGTENWKLEINVADLYNDYKDKKKTTKEFNTEYYKRLIEYKEDIIGLSATAWNELVKILDKMRTKELDEELNPIYDNIYSWGDKNDVLIKAK